MKKSLTLLISLSLFAFANNKLAFGGENSENMRITQIVARNSGHHNIYFDGIVPQNEGCTHNDRAILVETGEENPGGRGMFSLLLLAFSMDIPVQIRVDGCALLNPEGSTTDFFSPRITKLHIIR